MTDPEINRAVAEECGWDYYPARTVWSEHFSASIPVDEYWKAPDSTEHSELRFTTSLDACREFESLLTTFESQVSYRYFILKITEPGGEDHGFRVITATPLQRCQAFLRLRGKWKE